MQSCFRGRRLQLHRISCHMCVLNSSAALKQNIKLNLIVRYADPAVCGNPCTKIHPTSRSVTLRSRIHRIIFFSCYVEQACVWTSCWLVVTRQNWKQMFIGNNISKQPRQQSAVSASNRVSRQSCGQATLTASRVNKQHCQDAIVPVRNRACQLACNATLN